MKKWMLFVSIGILVGCSRYYLFDQYYDQRNWAQASEILQSISQTNTTEYLIRRYRLLLQLSIHGDTNAFSNLVQLIDQGENSRVAGYYQFAKLYVAFVDAVRTRNYDVILSQGEPLSRFPEEFQPIATQLLGICYLIKDDPKQAKMYLQKSYIKEPFFDTLYFLGLAHLMVGDESAAIVSWKQILSGRPGGVVEAMSYFQLGELAYQKGDFLSALDLYYQAVNIYPDSEIFVDKIAFCYQKLKNKKLSEKFRKMALRINKDYATAWFYLNFN